MSTREKLIAARVSMLALADQLQNISRACKTAGRTPWQTFQDGLTAVEQPSAA